MESVGAKALIAQAIADGTIRSIGADLNLLQDILNVLPENDTKVRYPDPGTPGDEVSLYYDNETKQRIVTPWSYRLINSPKPYNINEDYDVKSAEFTWFPGVITDCADNFIMDKTGSWNFSLDLFSVNYIDVINNPDVVFSICRAPKYANVTFWKDGVESSSRVELSHDCSFNGSLGSPRMATTINLSQYGITESAGVKINSFEQFWSTSNGAKPKFEIDELEMHFDSSHNRIYLDKWKGRYAGINDYSGSIVKSKFTPVFENQTYSHAVIGNWSVTPTVSVTSQDGWQEFSITNGGSAYAYYTYGFDGVLGAAFKDCIDATTGTRPITGVTWTKV